jgi:hypothetical protein
MSGTKAIEVLATQALIDELAKRGFVIQVRGRAYHQPYRTEQPPEATVTDHIPF